MTGRAVHVQPDWAGYAGEEAMGYVRIRQTPAPGRPFRLDRRYLAAQLPLVNPGHADTIAEDGEYQMGRYAAPRTSLVLPVPAFLIEEATAFRRLDAAIRQGSLGRLVAWPAMARRRNLMHATVCSSLAEADVKPVLGAVRAHLARHGPVAFRIGGPLVGGINTGRIYFPVYPAELPGRNVLHAVQDAARRPRTDIFLIGYYNFTDHLGPAEADELGAILREHGEVTLAEATSDVLWVLCTNDDLVLSGRVAAEVRVPPGTGWGAVADAPSYGTEPPGQEDG